MFVVLGGIEKYGEVYLDEISIFFRNKKKGRLIQNVFSQQHVHKLNLKLAKCEFFKKEILYFSFTKL